MQDSRGQDLDKLRRNVRNGEMYEEQFKIFLYQKYSIKLIKEPYQFSPFDFSISGYPNILIEYKALNVKRVVNNQPFFYEFIVIPKSKIDSYIKISKEGISLNRGKKRHFIYIISLFYFINEIKHKQHKYTVLDLENIQKHCNIITNVLGNGVDRAEHYQIDHNNFKPLDTLQETLRALVSLEACQKHSNKFPGETSNGTEQSKGSTTAPAYCEEASEML